MLCPICEKATMIRKLEPFYFKNLYFGKYEADICPSCGEVLFTQKASREIDKKAILLKVWGINRKLAKNGDMISLSVELKEWLISFYKIASYDIPKIKPITGSFFLKISPLVLLYLCVPISRLLIKVISHELNRSEFRPSATYLNIVLPNTM